MPATDIESKPSQPEASSQSCCPTFTKHKIGLYVGLGFLQLLCYALPYFLAVWHVVDKFTEETTPQDVTHERDLYLHGLDITAGMFWNIMIGVFVGLVTMALVFYFAIMVSWRHAREWWRPSILTYVLFCSMPIMVLFGVTYKIYAPKIPCSVVKSHSQSYNATDNCSEFLGESQSLLQAANFASFDEWSMFILQIVLLCLVVNEWFAKFQEIKQGAEVEEVYPIIKQCGAEFFPLYDIAAFQGLLLQDEIFANNALTATIVAFTLLSTLKFAPSPPKDEFGKNKLNAEKSRTYSACYYLNQIFIQDVPYLLVRIYIMATLRNGKTLNELLFSFKNAFYIAWYVLLIVLLFIAAEKAEDEREIHVVEVQKHVADVMKANVRSHKQKAQLQNDTETLPRSPSHTEKSKSHPSKNGNVHAALLEDSLKRIKERKHKKRKSGRQKTKDNEVMVDEAEKAKRKIRRRKKKKGISPRPKVTPENAEERNKPDHDARFILSRDLQPV